jgi:hypothetical protein
VVVNVKQKLRLEGAVAHVHQGYRQCGQACIAMILGVSLDEAVKIVGKRRGTQTKSLVWALRSHGFKCSDRLQRLLDNQPLPRNAILKVKLEGGRNWHWVLIWNGMWHDPDCLSGKPLRKVNRWWANQVSSYLEVWV